LENICIKFLYDAMVNEMNELISLIIFQFFSPKLSCEALGNPNPNVEWLKDGQTVQDTLSMDGVSSSSLNFGYLTTSDAGTYTCRATNKFGKVKIRLNNRIIEAKKKAFLSILD